MVGEGGAVGRLRPGGEPEGPAEPVQGHPTDGGEVVLGQEPVQAAVVGAEVHHAVLHALAAGVAAPLDAGLEDMGGGQQLQLLVPGGEEEPGLLPVGEAEDHFQVGHAVGQQGAQAAPAVLPQGQGDALKGAVHEGVAAQPLHRTGEGEPGQVPAVVEGVIPHGPEYGGEDHRADGGGVVPGLRPAAGDPDLEGVGTAGEVGLPLGEGVGSQGGHRLPQHPVGQYHMGGVGGAAQEGDALRRPAAGEEQLALTGLLFHTGPSLRFQQAT